MLPELVETDDWSSARDYSAMAGYLVQVNKELHQEVASKEKSTAYGSLSWVCAALVGMVAAVGLFAFLHEITKK